MRQSRRSPKQVERLQRLAAAYCRDRLSPADRNLRGRIRRCAREWGAMMGLSDCYAEDVMRRGLAKLPVRSRRNKLLEIRRLNRERGNTRFWASIDKGA